MTFNDKTKIMDGLKHCLAENCEGCPYRPEAHEDYIVCSKQPMLDALEILEEQDPVRSLLGTADCIREMLEG